MAEIRDGVFIYCHKLRSITTVLPEPCLPSQPTKKMIDRGNNSPNLATSLVCFPAFLVAGVPLILPRPWVTVSASFSSLKDEIEETKRSASASSPRCGFLFVGGGCGDGCSSVHTALQPLTSRLHLIGSRCLCVKLLLFFSSCSFCSLISPHASCSRAGHFHVGESPGW